MATAKIIPVGSGELDVITELYNGVFNPAVDPEFFRRRFQGRYNVTLLMAELEKQPVGFAIGFEIMPSTYFVWLCGVTPDARRLSIGTQLMRGLHGYAADHEYSTLRFECQNQHRPMLHFAITEGYDLVGIRWATATGNNVVIFEKDLR